MTDAVLPSRQPWAERLATRLPWVLLALLALLLALRLQLVFTANVNWDEFLYLSKVHAHLRGELGSAFQSFQVHLFTWLAWVSDNEVEQVKAARLAVFGLNLCAAGLLYKIGRRFLSPSAALFALLCLQGFSFVMAHGASFRADPICAFFILAAIALLLHEPRGLWAPSLAGFCFAMSVLVSVKSLLFLPAIVGIFIYLAWRPEARFATLKDFTLFSTGLLISLLLLYGLHQLSLPITAKSDAVSFAGQSASKVFLTDSFFPRWLFFLRSLLQDPIAWVAIVGGAGLAGARFLDRDDPNRREAFLLLAFATPLLILPLYRNAFPYFYVFILTPAILLAGHAFECLQQARRERAPALPLYLVLGLAVVSLAGLVGRGAVIKGDETRAQHQLVAAVHQVFPEPVPYIDWAGMISRYPKVGFFMSSWLLENYATRNRPIFADLIAEHRPLFLLTDVRALDLERPWGKARAGDGFRLFRGDYNVLKASYLPHWGAIWVAGKALSFVTSGEEKRFDLLIPGRYRIESNASVIIDDVLYGPGEVIELGVGEHRAAATSVTQSVALRWAEARPGPTDPPLDQPIYRGF